MSFAYPDSRENAIEHVSFRAEPGQTVAFIGATGSGKSSLVNLVPRLYDVTGGQVLVDGVDVRDWDLAALRGRIGYVPQQSVLFKGTVAGNIAYGGVSAVSGAVDDGDALGGASHDAAASGASHDAAAHGAALDGAVLDGAARDGAAATGASHDAAAARASSSVVLSDAQRSRRTSDAGRIRAAADVAQATEFIDRMDDGFDSSIAQGGSNVSGGQKQRLSIARAVHRHPEFLVFDDSFSALDFRTDRQVRDALAREAKDATKLIVAQRIGTIMNADRIVVLDQGRVVGQGTHRQLLESCDVYRQIAESQLSASELAV